MIRVGLPLIAATLLAHALTGRDGVLDPVLWSLYCELIYYSLYPAFRALVRIVSWSGLLIFSIAPMIAVFAFVQNPSGFLWGYGLSLTWVYGLPVWISGAVLASRLDSILTILARWQIPAIRTFVWLASSIATALHFHSPVRYAASMIVFAPIAYLWLQWEIADAVAHGTVRVFERLGQGGYSLYLIHPLALSLVAGLQTDRIVKFGIGLASCACLTFVFFWTVERPSHQLARWLARKSIRVGVELRAVR